MDIHSILDGCLGFEWDKGNSPKSLVKHRVTEGEAEQVFFNEPVLVTEDEKHSGKESRFHALGKTDDERGLFIVFTVRRHLVRVISARNMNRKERAAYEEFKVDTEI